MSLFGSKKTENTDNAVVDSFGSRAFRLGGSSVAAVSIALVVAVLANVLIKVTIDTQ